MTVVATTFAICLLQRANAQTYSSAVYSSGGGSTWLGKTYPYTLNVFPYGGNDMGGGGPTDCVCAGAIKATFSKTGGTSLPPAQTHAIVEEQAYATWTGTDVRNGWCDDGLGDSEKDSSTNGPPFPLNLGVSTGTHYVSGNADSGGDITVSCTPASAVANGPASYAEVAFSASIVPVTISLSGTTLVKGSPEILPGQMCAATLNVPTGFKCTSYTWTISGTYYASWQGMGSAVSNLIPVKKSLLTWPNATYPATGSPATPEWYWDDTVNVNGTTETVSCIATFTAPDGANVTASAATSVDEVVPPQFMKAFVGTTEIYQQTAPLPGLWLELTGTPPGTVGFENDFAVDQDTDFQGTANCGVVQLLISTDTVNGGSTGEQGLDAVAPYYRTYICNGVTNKMHDYPGVSLTAAIQKVSVNDSFSDFLMYLPPADSVGQSQWVPLAMLTWNWNATATQPKGGWQNPPANGIIGAGSATASTENPVNYYPAWTHVVSSP